MIYAIGLLAWSYVGANFCVGFYRRRSQIRACFVVMASGWPLLLLRELGWLHRRGAIVFLVAGVTAGLLCSLTLFVGRLNNPRALD